MTTRKYLAILPLGLILLWPLVVIGTCNDDARIRVVRGDKQKAEKLYTPIMGKFPSWDKDFHREEFSYVGSLKNGTEVALLFTEWGFSCRGTHRLMLFRQSKYLGSYGIDFTDGELKLVENKIVFPNLPSQADIGNVIDLSGPVPHTVHLGGGFYEFIPSGS
jgi:hypothetical protein